MSSADADRVKQMQEDRYLPGLGWYSNIRLKGDNMELLDMILLQVGDGTEGQS